MSYLFQDTERAALRLRVVADVFAFSSRPFLQQMPGRVSPEVAVDLGCGPGYTTSLLAEVTRSPRVIGLDSSEHFLSLASSHAPAHCSFIQHDVTTIPFPTGPVDLIFARLLLSHLQDPLSVLERWGTQLRPQGYLLLEEVEWIHTEHPLLSQYLAIQADLFRQQAIELYIGPLLEQHQVSKPLRRRLSSITPVPVATAQVATMFSLNLPAWKHHPFIQRQYGTIIDQLEQDLLDLAQQPTAAGEHVWGMRQLVYERTADE